MVDCLDYIIISKELRVDGRIFVLRGAVSIPKDHAYQGIDTACKCE